MFVAGFRLAVTLLTAIPLPGGRAAGPPSRQAAGAAMIWAPVIGLLLGSAADGLGSRRPAAQALDIMRRSDIGPFGVAVLVLTVLLQVTALTQADALGRGVTSVIAAAVTGRLALTWACMRGVPAARGEGMGAMVAGTLHPAVPAALSAAALAGAASFHWIFAVAIAAGLAVSAGVTRLAVRRLGGITGDVLGALTEIATAGCLLVLALS